MSSLDHEEQFAQLLRQIQESHADIRAYDALTDIVDTTPEGQKTLSDRGEVDLAGRFLKTYVPELHKICRAMQVGNARASDADHLYLVVTRLMSAAWLVGRNEAARPTATKKINIERSRIANEGKSKVKEERKKVVATVDAAGGDLNQIAAEFKKRKLKGVKDKRTIRNYRNEKA